MIFPQKIANITETVQYRAKLTAESKYELVHSLLIGDIYDDVTTTKQTQVISSRRL